MKKIMIGVRVSTFVEVRGSLSSVKRMLFGLRSFNIVSVHVVCPRASVSESSAVFFSVLPGVLVPEQTDPLDSLRLSLRVSCCQ